MRPRLFLLIFATEAKRILGYRADFWVGVIGGLAAGIAIPWFLWSSIFAQRAASASASSPATIGGFTLAGMVTYYIAVTLIVKVVRGSDLPATVSTDIYEGGLNRYLLYPASYLPFKYAQQLGSMLPAFVQLVVFGTIFLLLLDPPPEVGIDIASAGRAAVSMAAAHALYFALVYPLQLVAFWAENVWSLSVLLRFVSTFLGGAMLPLDLYPASVRVFLEWTPFPLLYAAPVDTLLGRNTFEEWVVDVVLTVGWTALILFGSRWIWKRGTLQYSGVGI